MVKRPSRRGVWRGVLYGAALTLLSQPGCGGGCSLTDTIQPLPAPLPNQTILENGIQIRLTNAGFAFVEQNLGTIIDALLGDHICIPPNVSASIGPVDFTLCPSNPLEGPAFTCDGAPGCRVDLNIDSSNFSLNQSGNTALLNVSIQLDAGMGVATQAQGGCVLEPPIACEDCNNACFGPQCDCAAGRINMDAVADIFFTTLESTCDVVFGARDFVLDAELGLFIDGNRQLGVELRDINLVGQLNNSNQINVRAFEENRGDPGTISVCNTLDEALQAAQSDFLGFILGFFEGTINNQINNLVQGFLPDPPGIEGVVDLGSLLAGALPLNLKGQLEMSLVAGGYVRSEASLNNAGAENQRGLSLGMRVGINSDFTPNDGDDRSTPNPCVRDLPLPLPGTPSQFRAGERFFERTAEFAQNTIPGTNTPYELGLGISEAFLDSVGFHAFNSGMLCLQVGSDIVGADLLSSQTLGLLLPSLNELVPSPGSTLPIFIQLRPQNPLDFSIGAGGAADALIQARFDNLDIDMYTLLDDRLVRLFTANTSFAVGIDLTVDANAGTIIPVIDTSQLAGLQVTISNNELLTEDAAAIEGILPTLIQIALPALTNAIGPIEPPVVGGFTLDLTQTSFQRVQAVVGDLGTEDFIGIFTSLLFDPNAVGNKINEDILVDTKAKLATLHLPERFELFAGMRASDWPGVQLDLERYSSRGEPLEWQVRVNGGAWSPFFQDPQQILHQPIFMLQGEHIVEVRAQEIGNPATLDPTPAELLVRIDTEAPEASFKFVDQGVRVLYSDIGTARSLLKASYRVDGGDWVELPADGIIPSSVLGGAAVIEVQIEDEAGHVTVRSLEVAGTPVAAGCSVGTEGSGSGVVALFGLFLGALLLFRRRRGALQALLLGLVVIFGEACACGRVPCAFDSDCTNLQCADGEVAFCDVANTGFCQCGPPQAIDPGAAGRFADIAADGDEAVIVAYNQTFGDLILARVTPPVANVTDFIFVDGVPDGPVVGDPNGVRDGIRDPGPDVGQDASVVLDASGNAHIAYLDVSNGDLKYARVDVTGQDIVTMTVDADSGFVGRYTDIAIGADGTPQISYMAVDVGGSSQLRLVKANVANPQAANDWATPLILDSAAAIPPEPSNLLDTPKGTGLFTSMKLDSNGNTFISYHDSISLDAKVVQLDPTLSNATIINFSRANNNDNGNDLSKAGEHCSLFIDSNNVAHLVFFRRDDDVLLYLSSNTSNIGQLLAVEFVDNSIRDENGIPVIHKIGADATVFGSTINGQNRLFATYHDGTSLDVVLARRNGDGSWTPFVISGDEANFEGSKGFFTTATVSGNNPNIAFIANMVINRQADTTALEVLSVDLATLP